MRFFKKSSPLKAKIIRENVDVLPTLAGNAYSISRALYQQIEKTPDNIITIINESLNEADISYEVPENELGGIIVVSTDVNAIALSKNRFINYIKQKYLTFHQRLIKNSILDKIADKHNIYAWTIGHFMKGKYHADDGSIFSEKSLAVEVVGVRTNTLLDLAEDICAEFHQESVMVKDYTTRKIMFVKPKKETNRNE